MCILSPASQSSLRARLELRDNSFLAGTGTTGGSQPLSDSVGSVYQKS